MEKYDNILEYYEECEFSVKRIKNMRFRKYLARICGADSIYGYQRKFLRYDSVDADYGNIYYSYGDLQEGVYETCVRYYRPGEETPAFADRKICIIFDGVASSYAYGTLNRRTVLKYVDDIRNGTFVM